MKRTAYCYELYPEFAVIAAGRNEISLAKKVCAKMIGIRVKATHPSGGVSTTGGDGDGGSGGGDPNAVVGAFQVNLTPKTDVARGAHILQ